MITKHQIKTVIPVSFSDVHLLEPWINVFRAHGGAKNHPVEFHPTPSVAGITKEAANAIKNFCGSVEVFTTPQDFKGGWPMACNAHFGVVVRSLASRSNGLPWIWNELDMLPMTPQWSEMLIQEYVLTGGRGAMGVIMPMVKPRNVGQPSEFIFIDKSDPYLVGAAIYDADHYAMCGGITDNAFRQTEPFDFAYRFYVKKMWRSTALMSSAGRTVNYREEDGEIRMDDLPGKKEHQKRAGTVPHGTVLHHGCKDTSLAMLLLNRAGREYQSIDEMLANLASEVVKTAPALPPAAPRQLPQADRISVPKASSDTSLAASFATLKAQTAARGTLPATLPPAPKPAPEPVQEIPAAAGSLDDEIAAGLGELASSPDATTEAPTGASDEVGGEPASPTLEDLRKSISEAAKPMKIEAFAQQLQTTEAHIKSLVKTPKSGVNIVGGVWLKMGA